MRLTTYDNPQSLNPKIHYPRGHAQLNGIFRRDETQGKLRHFELVQETLYHGKVLFRYYIGYP